MHAQWNAWMAAEDEYIARESPEARSDLVISGETGTAGDIDDRVVILRKGRVHA